MNIAVVGLENFPKNKVKIPDDRLKKLKEIFKSKEIVPASCFFLEIDKIVNCEGVICSESVWLDLIVSDMDFLDKKLSDAKDGLLEKAFSVLEKEIGIYEGGFSEEELYRLGQFPLITVRPYIILPDDADMSFLPKLWWQKFGRGMFFTAGQKDSHAWIFRLGQTAVECASIIHTEIGRGFVRAEVVNYDLLVEYGSLNAVRQRGLLRLEGRDYKVQEGDWLLIRTTG